VWPLKVRANGRELRASEIAVWRCCSWLRWRSGATPKLLDALHGIQKILVRQLTRRREEPSRPEAFPLRTAENRRQLGSMFSRIGDLGFSRIGDLGVSAERNVWQPSNHLVAHFLP
jgi:hypothetical protein